MLDAAGFEADSDYVQGLATMFGKYAADGSGGIELCVASDRCCPVLTCLVCACELMLCRLCAAESSGICGRS